MQRMPNVAVSVLRVGALLAGSLMMLVALAWGATALWYQANRTAKGLLVLAWCLLYLVLLADLWHGHALRGASAALLVFALLLAWWRSIPPSNARIWADDVARISHAEVLGDEVKVYNVRNFRWTSRTDFQQAWETRRYDLTHLVSLDMILSYWTGPAIAHMLMSFGFSDGERLAFSVEIRRERDEDFSEIGGFFKQFELSIVAADERDVIAVRTNARREHAYLYRLAMPITAMRSLFLAYIDQANALKDTPRFYNTITTNCTTLVYQMMKRIIGRLPLDARVLLTGYLPAYVHRVGGLDQRYSLAELRSFGHITPRAQAAGPSNDFSEQIRRGIPPLPD
jgi:hypothetical protein